MLCYVLLLRPVMRATEVRCTVMTAEHELKCCQGRLRAKKQNRLQGETVNMLLFLNKKSLNEGECEKETGGT